MFLQLFKPFYNAIRKDPLPAIIAFLLAGIVSLGIYHVEALRKKDEDCKDLRADDKAQIKEQNAIISRQQERMFNAILRETEKETAINDSIIKKSIEKEINTIMP